MQLRDERDLSRELVSHQRMWSGPVFALDTDTLRLEPGADPIGRQYLAHHGAVAVVALREGEDSSQIDGTPEVLMIRQYRHPVRANLWELPAGLMDHAGLSRCGCCWRGICAAWSVTILCVKMRKLICVPPGCLWRRRWRRR